MSDDLEDAADGPVCHYCGQLVTTGMVWRGYGPTWVLHLDCVERAAEILHESAARPEQLNASNPPGWL